MADSNYDPDRLMTDRPTGTPMMTVRPRKLDRDDAEKLVRKYNPDITQGAVKGEVDNIVRESGLNFANDTGDHGTSGGGYQYHNERLAGVKAFAQKEGKPWTDPEVQIKYARMEKERDYPALLKMQQTVDDRGRNEDAFKRIFERPASVLWGNDAGGQPVLGNDRFRFSDYAMKEHDGRKNTDMLMMTPAEYLDLSPELGGKPFESPSGRSLKKSFDRGDPIESVPTLDVAVDGPTATVTDQDGRHRALLAQQEGIDAIPVAVRRTGDGEPKEIVGMNGVPMAHDFPKASEVKGRQPRQETQEQPKEPISLLGRIGEAIIPKAEAAEADPWAKFTQPPAGQAQQTAAPAQQTDPWAQYTGGAQQDQPSGGGISDTVQAGVRGAAKGLGQTVLAGQELVGKGMEAVGIPGGEWLTKDARTGIENLNKEMAPTEAAHPIAAGVGDFLGGMAVPGGVAGKLVAPANALRAGAVAGGLSGLLTPGSEDSFWHDKALETGVGAGVGAAAGKLGNALSGLIAPQLRATVAKLMGEGVQLTPGQMAGGASKRVEDILASVPGVGSQVRAAQKRSFETFNRAAINRSLEDIGQKLPDGLDSGHAAIAEAQDKFTTAYKSVIPRMRGVLDNQLRRDMLDVLGKAQRENLPQEYIDKLHHVIKTEIVDRLQPGGHITGEDAQKIGTQLDAIRNPMRISENPYIQHMGRLLGDADAAMDNMMARQNPVLQATKDRIDAGYAKFKTVQRASTATGTHADGTFTPAQLNNAIKARDRSKDKAAFARGDAMMQDLAAAARDVLPQKVADSGTPERALLMAILSGGATIEPHTAAGIGALSVPYIPPVSKAINWAVNKLAQPAGPTRNALATMFQGAGQVAAPVAGSAAASMVKPQGNPP